MSDRLSFVRDDAPGIRRRGRRRFRYVDARGREVPAKVKARIESLAIPPAWSDVWICPDPGGHIQATGRDARGRKQYRYHSTFRNRRERAKFRGLVPFGEALGDLRTRIDADQRSPNLSRERVIAAVAALLDQTYVRVGNEGYARANKTFGLTTLRCRHVDVNGERVHFRFAGKGGKPVDVTCCDGRLARVVRRCHELPGQLLFQYENGDGAPSPVSSGDLNDYLREATGLDSTAKTFRTWGASLLAARRLADVETPSSAAEFGRVVNAELAPVAEVLHNTVAVCRSSYVHPTVLDSFEKGTLAAAWLEGPSRGAKG
ncbi:MAG: topoisomerase [Actinomycetota bacterium]